MNEMFQVKNVWNSFESLLFYSARNSFNQNSNIIICIQISFGDRHETEIVLQSEDVQRENLIHTNRLGQNKHMCVL